MHGVGCWEEEEHGGHQGQREEERICHLGGDSEDWERVQSHNGVSGTSFGAAGDEAQPLTQSSGCSAGQGDASCRRKTPKGLANPPQSASNHPTLSQRP